MATDSALLMKAPPLAASAIAHARALAAAEAAVGTFSTRAGPDRGNLACVWALRCLLHRTLGFWVTLSDNTDDFATELLAHFGRSFDEREVADGGIIVSPSTGREGTPERVVGHVGILGPGHGDRRTIYSNCSAKALWLNHYTVASWRDRYQAGKGLEVLCFPLPQL